MAKAGIRLTDPHLFGNDAAEDEDAEIFASYALERPELGDFTSPSRRICIARAYKGEGKSALLRLSARQIVAPGPTRWWVRACRIRGTANPMAVSNGPRPWLLLGDPSGVSPGPRDP